jgi:cysteine desulfurase
MGPIYLDNNSTTRPLPQVVEAVDRMLRDHWHNPSSMHRPGQEARQLLELARTSVAALIGARPRELVFTSGATESIDLATRGVLEATGRRTIVTTRIEHEAVRDVCEVLERRGEAEIRWLPVTARGIVDIDALPDLLDDTVALVSIQWANNETGAIQPIDAIGAQCRERGVLFHSDATQWIGKMPTDVTVAPVDMLSFSAHKFHGPKGVGGLWLRRGVRLRPRLHGTQEQERRGGTENVPGIVGMGAAAECAMQWLADAEERTRLAAARDAFEQALLNAVPDAQRNGPASPRLWNTTNIGFPRLESEALLLLLSERGVCASAGAACSSGSLDPSPVLLAMGVPEAVAHGSLRFSISRETTDQELHEAARRIAECVERVRASSSSLDVPQSLDSA